MIWMLAAFYVWLTVSIGALVAVSILPLDDDEDDPNRP